MPFILAVSGKKQSGKDTLINSLFPILDEIGAAYRYSFADQLKKFLFEGMGLSKESIWGSDSEKNSLTDYKWDNLPYEIRKSNAVPGSSEPQSGNMSGRQIMQVFGTDIMRNYFDDKIWVKACFREILENDPDFALIPDMRFPSEVIPWIEKGGVIIRLMRDVSNGDRHSSEIALDNFDWEKYTDQVLVIPACSTKTECLRLSIEWLAPRIESYLEKNKMNRQIEILRSLTDKALRISDE